MVTYFIEDTFVAPEVAPPPEGLVPHEATCVGDTFQLRALANAHAQSITVASIDERLQTANF